MRIKSSQPAGRREFWRDTQKWVQSRTGFYQFLLAMALGLALAAMAGAVYKLGAWKFIEPPLRAMFAEAQQTADVILESNDLPILHFDIGFAEYPALAQQREEALEKGILLLDDDDWMRAQIRYLELYWQADNKPGRDYTIFIHILDASGNLVAQQDGMPRDNNLPTSRWRAGELLDDTHLITLPADMPPGEYQAALGMYVWQTGERLTALEPGGEELPNDLILLDQTITVDN